MNEQETHSIGIEAYVYLYPLVLMDVTRRVMTSAVEPNIGKGPPNAFAHVPEFPPAGFRDVIRPNFDTLYSIAWLDLTREPQILTAADTAGRYYMLPLLDMWTDVFAAPGSRTSGTGEQRHVIVPPRWTGTLPADVPTIQSPTPFAWILGRTQTNGVKDYDAVHRIQTGYQITPLSHWGKPLQEPAPPRPDPSLDTKTEPVAQVNRMSGLTFFKYAAALLKQNPPHVTDWSIVARLARIGICPGKSFDFERLRPELRAALDSAPVDALKVLRGKVPTVARVVNGWSMNTDTMGVYGNYYLKRAIVAMVGLGANQPEDAIYPLCLADADGKPLDGGHAYVHHFDKAELPPVDAFWSVTMYDGEGFHVANELDRFAIGDRDALRFNDDGSLDLYYQHENPGPNRVSNWLPAPKGPLGITMRLYAPRAEALDGRWNPPAIRRAQ